jgi:signal transduction histidine kinase
VDVGVTDGKGSLAVVDTGYGVPPAMRPALFTRFAGAQRGGGSGLGLYIVRRIAEANGGTATYAPNEPSGSRFTLTLPLARPVMEHA